MRPPACRPSADFHSAIRFECYTTVAALPRCSFAALPRCSRIMGNIRVTLEYARVTLDGVTALDLLCSPPSEFFGAHHHPDMTASVTTDRYVYMSE